MHLRGSRATKTTIMQHVLFGVLTLICTAAAQIYFPVNRGYSTGYPLLTRGRSNYISVSYPAYRYRTLQASGSPVRRFTGMASRYQPTPYRASFARNLRSLPSRNRIRTPTRSFTRQNFQSPETFGSQQTPPRTFSAEALSTRGSFDSRNRIDSLGLNAFEYLNTNELVPERPTHGRSSSGNGFPTNSGNQMNPTGPVGTSVFGSLSGLPSNSPFATNNINMQNSGVPDAPQQGVSAQQTFTFESQFPPSNINMDANMDPRLGTILDGISIVDDINSNPESFTTSSQQLPMETVADGKTDTNPSSFTENKQPITSIFAALAEPVGQLANDNQASDLTVISPLDFTVMSPKEQDSSGSTKIFSINSAIPNTKTTPDVPQKRLKRDAQLQQKRSQILRRHLQRNVLLL